MIKWDIYKRGSIPIHVLDQACRGYVKYCQKYFGSPAYNFIYFADQDITYFVYDKDFEKKISNHLFAEIKNKSQNNFFNQWKKITSALRQAISKIDQTNLEKIPSKIKNNLYESFCQSLEQFYAFTTISVDVTEPTILGYLRKEFSKIPKALQAKENFDLLIEPVEPSFIAKKEIDLLKLSLDPKQANIKKFQKKYYWINFGWYAQPIYSLQDVEEDLAKIKLTKGEAKKKIKGFYKNFTQIKLAKKKLLLAIDSRGLFKLSQFLDKLVFYHDSRKYHQVVALYAINKILKSISQYNLEDLLWCKTEEIVNYLKNNQPINLAEITKRKHGSLVTIFKHKLNYEFGKNTKNKLLKILYNKQRLSDTREIKGVASSSGSVKGRVKIVFDPSATDAEFSKNDILVAPMTTPDFVPIMCRVGGVITDEGGMTCHAAIISRELGIPCVTGTKHATDILHDGEIILLNANRGIVKIL